MSEIQNHDNGLGMNREIKQLNRARNRQIQIYRLSETKQGK